GRMPDAEAYLKKGLEAAPGDQEISLSLAALYQTSGRFEEAKTLYTQLGERFPGDSRIVYNRALMALKMQQFAEAVTLFEKYLDMPGAYQKRGSVARTVEQLRQQLQMPPPKWAKK
ncbi:MAG: tetratricopeptide repeat protein, partial [Candidatus Sericytochromatia bacterium]|nr:tetratricopeptide repeat protein [Candidatus Sericytochromatia bacterium]